jgi:hypothetical protein
MADELFSVMFREICHGIVQEAWKPLVEKMRRLLPDLQVLHERAHGDDVLLESRVVFLQKDSIIDPACLSMSLVPREGQVMIAADITGETRGDVIKPTIHLYSPLESEIILNTAELVANQIAEGAEPHIVDALKDTKRVIFGV